MNDDEQEQETTARLAELLTRASWRLRRNERKALGPYNITFASARALRLLVEGGAMRMGDLAARLEIVPRTATTRVDDLEEAGLVTRSADPSDRRSTLVAPTAQGRELVTRLKDERRASAETMFATLSTAEKAELVRMLGLVVADSPRVGDFVPATDSQEA